jgi:hypothetical protein
VPGGKRGDQLESSAVLGVPGRQIAACGPVRRRRGVVLDLDPQPLPVQTDPDGDHHTGRVQNCVGDQLAHQQVQRPLRVRVQLVGPGLDSGTDPGAGDGHQAGPTTSTGAREERRTNLSDQPGR